MNVKPRQCWSVLESKAQLELDKVRASVDKAQKVHDKLLASQSRLKGMYEEYRLQSIAPKPNSLGMSDTLNQRQFMTQLMELLDRMASDITKSSRMLSLLKSKRSIFEIERQKMQSLDEQEKNTFKKLELKMDQRRMDEVGVMQFNLRQRS